MNLITIREGDGTKTRIVAGATPMAIAIVTFFRDVINLDATIENVETLDVLPVDETERAKRYMKTWQNINCCKMNLRILASVC